MPTDCDPTAAWRSQRPFAHVVMENWIDPKWAAAAAAEFPPLDDLGKWHRFTGEREQGKQEASASVAGPWVQAAHGRLGSAWFVEWMRQITGDPDLISDPERKGGGIHAMGRDARLAPHVDFNVMPSDPTYRRRVNVILFLSEWSDEWGGALTLGLPADPERVDIYPRPGRLVIFAENDDGWHGVIEPIRCPPDRARLSIPAYYFSPEREGDGPPRSTVFA